MQALGQKIGRAPQALSEMMLALDFMLDRPKEVIIVTGRSREQAEPLMAELRSTFVPNAVLVVAVEGKHLAAQQKLVPLVRNKRAVKNKPTAYVCEQGVCKFPTSDPAVFRKQISEVQPLGPPPAPDPAAES